MTNPTRPGWPDPLEGELASRMRARDVTHVDLTDTPMTNPTGDALKASAAQVTKGKIELWFFRDMLDQNRLALFSLFGIKAESVQTLGGQKLALHSVLSALSPVKQAPQPVATETQPIGFMDVDGLEALVDEVRARPTATEAPPVESQAAEMAEQQRLISIGMVIAAGVVMKAHGDDTVALEILGAAGGDSEATLRAWGVDDYDIDILRPILAAEGSAE